MPPSTGMRGSIGLRSAPTATECDGQIFLTAPLSIERSKTSASAARPSISVGVASAPARAAGAGIMEIAISDA